MHNVYPEIIKETHYKHWEKYHKESMWTKQAAEMVILLDYLFISKENKPKGDQQSFPI